MTESERRGFSPTDAREGFFFFLFFEHGCIEGDERNEVVVL